LQGTPENFVAQVQAILDASDELRFELATIHVPALVITGSQDLLTPLGDAEELAELIPGARLQELRGAAHGLMVEQPNAFNGAVLRFLADVDNGVAGSGVDADAADAATGSSVGPVDQTFDQTA
jgi:3-oxoadipate enol-lactonase